MVAFAARVPGRQGQQALLERDAFFQQRLERARDQPAFKIRVALLEILRGRFGRDVEARHDARVHRNEVELGHVCVHADQRLVDQPALVGAEQLEGGLGPLGHLLVVRHQHARPQGGDDLHGRDARPGRDPRRGLHGQGRDARHLQHPVQAIIVEHDRVGGVHVPAPGQVHLRPAVDDLPVGGVAAILLVEDLSLGIAVERQGDIPLLRQVQQAQQQPAEGGAAVAPIGQQQVRIVAAQQGCQVDQQRAGRFQAQAVGAPGGAHEQAGRFGVKGIDLRREGHGAQRGPGGVQHPGGIHHLKVCYYAIVCRGDLAARQREGAENGGMAQRQVQVGVVESQVRECLRGAAEQPRLVGGPVEARRQDGDRALEQVAALAAFQVYG